MPHILAIIPLGFSVSVGEVASHGGRVGTVLGAGGPRAEVRSREEEVCAKGARCRESGDKETGNGGRGSVMEGVEIADVAYVDEIMGRWGRRGKREKAKQ